ncbi:MAG: hydrogenase maturation nickel metallochaperone HypA [bacterium]|nr:hydrogenase maturation nickel metallochaperone HypA [bacterium]
MHELYIAESILNSVLDLLPAGITPERVTKVHLSVGQLDAVVSESLIFLFDAIKGTKGLPHAQLAIETIAVLCQCKTCAHQFNLDLPIFICPQCNGSDVILLQGRGISIYRIEAKDD